MPSRNIAVKRGKELQRIRPAAMVAAERLESRTMFAVGDIDSTFGNAGQTVAGFGSQVALTNIRDTTVLPDGRIIVAGRANQISGTAGLTDLAVARLNADGTPDTTFGIGGVAFFSSPATDDSAEALAVQADGKIVVTGFLQQPGAITGDVATEQLIVARFNADGTSDTSFGPEGARLGGGALDLAEGAAIKVLDGGQILVAGTVESQDQPATLLAKYNTDGSLDSTFGAGGLIVSRLTGGPEKIEDLAVQSDGKIVVAGTTSYTSSLAPTFLVERFESNGAADTSFGTNGAALANFAKVTAGSAFTASATSVIIQPDGKIVLGGFVVTGNADSTTGTDLFYNFGLARFSSGGKLDKKFGKAGVVFGSPNKIQNGFNGYEAVSRVIMEPGGGLIVSGVHAQTTAEAQQGRLDSMVAGYESNGRPDTAFATGGYNILGPFTSAGTKRLSPLVSGGTPTFQEIQERDAAIAVALADRLILVNSASGQVTVTRLIGNGSDLQVSIPTGLKSHILLGGTKATVAVPVSNDGNDGYADSVTISLVLSTDQTADETDITVAAVQQDLKLSDGKAKTFKLKFFFPQNRPDGDYFLIAKVDPSGADTVAGNNTAADTVPVTLTRPFVDLVGSFAGDTGAASVLSPGKSGKVSITVRNDGNVPAKGPLTVQIVASPDPTQDESDPAFTIAKPVGLSLKPGAQKTLKLTVGVPSNFTTGVYLLFGTLDGGGLSAAVKDPQDDTFSATTPLNIE